MNMDMVKRLVVERQGCNEMVTQRVMEKIAVLQPELRPLLEKWIEDADVKDDTDYSGYTLDSLKKDFGMDFTGALFTLDWLVRDPETAAAALAKGIR